LKRDIERGTSVALFGIRRLGKTTILNFLESELKNGIHPVVVRLNLSILPKLDEVKNKFLNDGSARQLLGGEVNQDSSLSALFERLDVGLKAEGHGPSAR
jgi:AAA+ ATPase superfamily predicted ATPase